MIERQPNRCFFANFIVGRCGSTLLTGYLNQIPDVVNYPELFHRFSAKKQREIIDCMVRGEPLESTIVEARIPDSGESPFENKDLADLAAVGFKAKYGDIKELREFLSQLYKYNFKIMYMTRHNLIRTCLSRLHAQQFYKSNKDYNIYSKHKLNKPIFVDIPNFVKLLESEEKYYNDLNSVVMEASAHAEICGLHYEALVARPAEVVNRLLVFLQSSYSVVETNSAHDLSIVKNGTKRIIAPLQMMTLKMTDHNMNRAIQNYEEFVSYFKKSRYVAYLD